LFASLFALNELLFQEFGCIAVFVFDNLLRRSCGDHIAPGLAAFGAEVYYIICHLYYVKVMLDYDYGIAAICQPLKHIQKVVNIGEVQPRSRLVEQIQGVAGSRLA